MVNARLSPWLTDWLPLGEIEPPAPA
ncbi:MAG: hypothetical protein RL721_2080, partial [Candidatus Eisenbacteria bacterium]